MGLLFVRDHPILQNAVQEGVFRRDWLQWPPRWVNIDIPELINAYRPSVYGPVGLGGERVTAELFIP